MVMVVYGDSRSGNCLKVKWTADRLGVPYEWREVDVMSGFTRTPEFLALNSGGQVPTVILPDGRPLAQSNAIMVHLAEGSGLVPAAAYDRAKMFDWLFWEQNTHEISIAVARFQVLFLNTPVESLDPRLVQRGEAALDRLESALGEGGYLVGEGLTLADIALVAYTRWAADGGFDLSPRPAIRRWVARIERDLGIA